MSEVSSGGSFSEMFRFVCVCLIHCFFRLGGGGGGRRQFLRNI